MTNRLRVREVVLIMTDLVLGIATQISSIISALAYDRGEWQTFLIWLSVSILSGTGCAGVSWWAWWQLKKSSSQ